MRDFIEIIGARQNNLKNIDVKIPRNKLTIITGVSGSGKSSLAFDVLFGEGQRLYLESLSTYARSRVIQVKKPDVDFVFGLSSVVSIEQHKGVRNPRSTVGTLTDISTYLRLLFSTLGKAYCPFCNKEILIKTPNQIVEYLLSLPPNTIIEILAPVFKIYDEDYRYLFDDLRQNGIGNVKIDNDMFDIGDMINLDEDREYKIDAFIDKFEITSDLHQQMLNTIRECQRIGKGFIKINILNKQSDVILHFDDLFKCTHQILMGTLLPWYFSPNEGDSACLTCNGLGIHRKAVPFLMINNSDKSIQEGAINPGIFNITHPFKYLVMFSLAKHFNFSLMEPFKDLPDNIKDIIFYGSRGEKFELLQPPTINQKFSNVGNKVAFEGLIPPINRWYKNTVKYRTARSYEEHIFFSSMIDDICPDCVGKKLLKQRFQVKINGRDIHQLGEISLSDLRDFLDEVKIAEDKETINFPILEELKKRLDLLIRIGIDYLNLDRTADSVSGGEIQRIRMATQIGSGLMGMVYILDEPSIGLHPRDNYRIINILKKLRDIGNTVIVVEHDLEIMRAADHILDIGPLSGGNGGTIVAQGRITDIMKSDHSLTGHYLSGTKKIELPKKRRTPNEKFLKIIAAEENNLKNLTVKIPLEIFVCITGISGSGKSSLINDVLYKALVSRLRDHRIIPGKHERIEGIHHINDIRNIDQSPIGRSSRSNPATYVGFFDKIREIFVELPESKNRKYSKTTYSYNSKDSGRCNECEGKGEIVTPLQFMPDVRITCPICKGKRFRQEVLEVKYNGFSIADILDLSVEKALDVFKDVRLIRYKLKIMNDLGLGYLKLGQSSATLSGGEAQRIKLATEIGKLKKQENNLYLFDEPSTGLHHADIEKLLQCIDRLIKVGNSVIVIEHNLDIIKMADYVIDLGPEGGKEGGYIIAEGAPEEIVKESISYTGQYLKPLLNI